MGFRFHINHKLIVPVRLSMKTVAVRARIRLPGASNENSIKEK